MTHAAAVRLTLVSADNATGFRGVVRHEANKSKPFQAQLQRGGKCQYLDVFATAEEAALVRARALKSEGSNVAATEPEQCEWAQCTDCGKWRRLLSESAADLPDVWTCAMSRDALRDSCEAAEEVLVDGEVEQEVVPVVGLTGVQNLSLIHI